MTKKSVYPNKTMKDLDGTEKWESIQVLRLSTYQGDGSDIRG